MKDKIHFQILIRANLPFRTIRLSIYNENIPNSEYLSRFGYAATKETIDVLEKMINGTLKWTGFEWAADDSFRVVSGKETSRIENHEIWDDWKLIGNYLTRDLLETLKVWKGFQEKYSIPENYRAVAKTAFEIIKPDPKKYDKYKNGTNSFFEVVIDNIHVMIQVEDMKEFELSSDEYVEQIK